MRTFFTLLCSIVALLPQAQKPQIVNEAIIKTETEFFARTENLEEAGNGYFTNTDLLSLLSIGRDGRITFNTTTYLKDNMVATHVAKMGRNNTNIRNYETGLTSSFCVYESFDPAGSVAVIHVMDTQIVEELYQKNKELIAKKKDTIELPQVKVYYQDLTKTIAGFPCKRAIVYLLYSNGKTGKIMVWYNEGIKLKHIASTGDPNYLSLNKYIGIPANQFNLLAAVKGFPMEYEMKMDKDVYLTVKVTELNLNKRVKDRYFKLPYDHRDIIYNKTPWPQPHYDPPTFGPIISDPSKEDN